MTGDCNTNYDTGDYVMVTAVRVLFFDDVMMEAMIALTLLMLMMFAIS